MHLFKFVWGIQNTAKFVWAIKDIKNNAKIVWGIFDFILDPSFFRTNSAKLILQSFYSWKLALQY